MGETANIAKMADKLSEELFGEFLWERTGPANVNWPCEEESHAAPTHPSDVVFYYNEPYARSRTYVNCDVKSYKTGSINVAAVRSACESLARSINCAEKSEQWRKLFMHDSMQAQICGLLFIYNHDGAYDKDFSNLLLRIEHKKLDLPPGGKIFVFGPDDIFWLNNIRYEIVQMRGRGELPPKDKCRFFYPHLVLRKKIQGTSARAATLETLTGPWIIMEYDNPDDLTKPYYVIFYRRSGRQVEEFLYLIDCLLHYQVVKGRGNVRIRALNPDAAAPALFEKAVTQYVDACDGPVEFKAQLSSISFSRIPQVVATFSDIEIGMG